MKKILFIAALSSLFILPGCETDIDINAPYEDITVVYGVVDPTDTTHYIKINKAFSGDANALDLATNADNYNYAAGDLAIAVEEFNEENQLVATYSVTRTTNEVPKDAGIFDNSTNVLYKFVAPSLNRNNSLKLTITNASLGKTISSETQLVKRIAITDPAISSKFTFWNGSVGSGQAITDRIGCQSSPYVGRIQVILEFNYIEHYTTASGLSPVAKKVEMIVGEEKTTTVLGGESYDLPLKGETFFDNIVLAVPQPSTVAFFSHRELQNISMRVNVAGTELSTFMDVEAPSNTVNQDKPNYTNINNGIGIWSSREVVLWESAIDPITQNQINIQNATISYLESLNLGFCFGTTGIGFPVAPCVQI